VVGARVLSQQAEKNFFCVGFVQKTPAWTGDFFVAGVLIISKN
jgi:hypothetical protein